MVLKKFLKSSHDLGLDAGSRLKVSCLAIHWDISLQEALIKLIDDAYVIHCAELDRATAEKSPKPKRNIIFPRKKRSR